LFAVDELAQGSLEQKRSGCVGCDRKVAAPKKASFKIVTDAVTTLRRKSQMFFRNRDIPKSVKLNIYNFTPRHELSTFMANL